MSINILNIASNSTLFFIMIGLIILSGFFSSSETAFASVNKLRLQSYVEEGRAGSKKALHCAENFDKTLATILIGNTVVNVLLPIIAVLFFVQTFSMSLNPEALASIVITIAILIFGETLPKTFAESHAEWYTLKAGPIIYYISIILTPFSFLLVKLQTLVVKKNGDEISVTEGEFESIIDTMESEGVLEEDEADLLQSVLDLNDTYVSDVMTPRKKMFTININKSFEEIKNQLVEINHSRIPFYDDNIDDIIGILHIKDFYVKLIKEGADFDIKEVLRTPVFVSKAMKIDDLIEEMQKEKQHIAVVSDENGSTCGIVTLEDALEELVGEIYDEDDHQLSQIMEIGENLYLVDAEIDIEELFSTLDIGEEPKVDYPNIKTWVYNEMKKLPKQNDKFKYTSKKLIKRYSKVNEVTYMLNFIINEMNGREITSLTLNVIKLYEEIDQEE